MIYSLTLQIDSTSLKELLVSAKPSLTFPDNLLLSEDLTDLQKQLIDEWKRFKYVAMTNSDPRLAMPNSRGGHKDKDADD